MLCLFRAEAGERKLTKHMLYPAGVHRGGPTPCKHAHAFAMGAGLVGKAAPLMMPSRFVTTQVAKPGLRKRNLPFLLSDSPLAAPGSSWGVCPSRPVLGVSRALTKSCSCGKRPAQLYQEMRNDLCSPAPGNHPTGL